MALELSSQFPILYPTTSTPKTSSYPQISTTQFKPPPIHTKPIIKRSTITRKTTQFTVKAATAAEEENPQPNDTTVSESQSEPETISTQKSSTDEPQSQPTNSTISDLGSEIKKAIKERDAAGGGGDLWSGVAEEIREIEWPAFGKVLGTTGVVLGVIAGSSVVLLTVNAVLAELSDRIFAGKGIQDFFG